jgi:S-adenosylmethionine synthetase
MGVDQTSDHEQGAGDQGIMFGYATAETSVFMPLPIRLAHMLARRLAEARKAGVLGFLRPDGKSQVTVEYAGGRPKRIEAVVVAAQHSPDVTVERLREAVIEEVVKKTVPPALLDASTKIHVNSTGRFVIGGPMGDSGLTGRKIIVDTYGGWGRHGGGCFSGKDPSKVDRSASYAARWAAKGIVAAGLAEQAEVQLAYSIGVAEPVSLLVNAFGTAKAPEEDISKALRRVLSFKPRAMIEALKLKRPIYEATASYGHFGREGEGFTWEDVSELAPKLREAAGLPGIPPEVAPAVVLER